MLKTSLLILINLLIALGVLYCHDRGLDYQPWETDSVLAVTPTETEVDALILGTSHAYVFSRFKENHAITAAALGPTILNLALPSGGGIRPARYLLEHFFQEKNRSQKVIYFLDPFIFFGQGANDAHKFVNYEPFQFDFFWIMLKNAYSYRQILTYVHSKFSYAWFFQQAQPMLAHTHARTRSSLTPELIAMRIDSLYLDGLNQSHFERYKEDFLAIARLCKAKGAPLYLVIPPTLLGPEPGAPQVLEFLRQEAQHWGYRILDLNACIEDPAYFYDLDHLNTQGVALFMNDHLAPKLK